MAPDGRTVIINAVISKGILPLYFHPDQETSAGVLRALYNQGIRVVEYTNRGPESLLNFKKLRSICDNELQGMKLGIGTIKDAASAGKFVDAGADFIISPGLPEDVFDVAYSNKILWIPGCMTATEIIKAEQFGLSLIKLFPGSLLGPSYLLAMREIFPGLLFMPTGGVDLQKENLEAWFKAGASAVGMGSKLISKKFMDDKNFAAIEDLCKKAADLILDTRNKL